jgi:hypothetical protein
LKKNITESKKVTGVEEETGRRPELKKKTVVD